MVGQIAINHGGEKKLIMCAQTDPRVSSGGAGGGTLGFKKDVETSTGTGKSVYILDGGSSVAMAYADPNATPVNATTVQYGGVKGGVIVGYYTDVFLMFKCTLPISP